MRLNMCPNVMHNQGDSICISSWEFVTAQHCRFFPPVQQIAFNWLLAVSVAHYIRVSNNCNGVVKTNNWPKRNGCWQRALHPNLAQLSC